METNANPLGSFVKAVTFAAEKHRNQRRKDADASPYINHPIALANVLANEAGVSDSTVLCAAILHDTIEDTETTEDELTTAFGSRVASVVVEVTDDKALEKHVRKQRQIEHAPHISTEAKLVKLHTPIKDPKTRCAESGAASGWLLRVQRRRADPSCATGGSGDSNRLVATLLTEWSRRAPGTLRPGLDRRAGRTTGWPIRG